MTYVLGVGDRHLENLLLTPDGRLFHVDFAYMFGHDPKPLPPPMKLTKEMIEAMGGGQSVHFTQFRQYCHTAYLVLRRYKEFRAKKKIVLDIMDMKFLLDLPYRYFS